MVQWKILANYSIGYREEIQSETLSFPTSAISIHMKNRGTCTWEDLWESSFTKLWEKKFESEKVWIVCMQRPTIFWSSPDGVIDSHTIDEVKCRFTGRKEKIRLGKHIPFLNVDHESNETVLLSDSRSVVHPSKRRLFLCCIHIIRLVHTKDKDWYNLIQIRSFGCFKGS